MASPLRTSARRTALRRAGIALVGTVGILLASAPASAEPGAPTSSADAARMVAERGHALEIVTEEFNQARDTLAAQQAAAVAAGAQLEKATAELAAAQQSVRSVARTAYTGESMGSFQAMMMSESADEFVSRVTTLQTIAGHQTGLVERAAAANVAAAQAQATATKAATDAQATFDAVAAQQADLQKQIDEFKAQFNQLSAEERRAAVAESSHTDEAAGEERADGARASRDDRSAPAPSAPVVANSQAAQVAVNAALAQRGKPYVWAAGGPNAFDCSGLTQYAFRAAGISLPHSSRGQSGMGQAVSRDQLQPGDLVFFYRPVSHVGIYIGNGQMVHAPTSGDVVKIGSVDSMRGFSGARRIAG
ncbi:C40 family peptidase [Blastococcus atacamensis]|uniref:C40 family peptidase n=1 Tax=Blastococcus atacamensis TaxID=2070508 RepID=UPI000CEBF5A4|nr:C40 family peptidase [Blastococcus atacamensis]